VFSRSRCKFPGDQPRRASLLDPANAPSAFRLQPPDNTMADFTMDQILDALDRNHQRATYGAVAALLGKSPRVLMQGRERDQRHSWVVSRKNGEPTGYEATLVHPALRERDTVLETKEALGRWLADITLTRQH
jgi:hypothetical protein